MRLVLALERVPQELATLEPVWLLAREIGATIDALLVHNENLMRYALLPFAQEVDLLSGEARALSVTHLERSWSAETRRLEALFRDAARPHQVRFSLQTKRGDLVQALAALNEEAEALAAAVVGGVIPVRSDVNRLPEAPHRRSLVAVFLDQSPEATSALAMAMGIARLGGRGLIVGVHPETTVDFAATLSDKQVRARVVRVLSRDSAHIAAALAQPDLAVLVVPASLREQVRDLARILAHGPERLLVLAH